MDSIDKLKKYVDACHHSQVATIPPINMVTVGVEKLTKLIDDVEEDVERLRDKIRNQRKQLEEVQDALHRRNEGELKREWLRKVRSLEQELIVTKLQSLALPKDDDDQLIQHNDRMEWPDGRTFDVIGFGIRGTLFYVDGDGSIQWTSSRGKRHHEEDVRDVLMEFAAEIVGVANRLDDHEVTDAIDEYAGKLQLKEAVR